MRLRTRLLLYSALAACALRVPAAWAAGEMAAVDAYLAPLFDNPHRARDDAPAAVGYLLSRARAADDPLVKEVALRLVAARDAFDLAPSESFEPALRALLDQDLPGPTADLARTILARTEARQGAFDAALELRRTTGEVHDWLVCGPFGRLGHAEFYTAFPPETGMADLDAALPGASGLVHWRPLGPDPFTGRLRPYEHVHPHREKVVYLFAQVKSPEPRAAFAHVETAASWVLWVNGRRTGEADRLAAHLPRQSYAPAPLRAGWNRLLLKVYAPDGEADLRVRLVDAEGWPLADLETTRQPVLHPLGRDDEEPASAQPLAWALPRLQVRVEQASASWPAHAALATLYQLEGVHHRAVAAAQAAVDHAPDKACLHALLGEIVLEADHLPLGVRANRSRRSFRDALRVDPEYVPALIGLARLDQADEQPRAALTQLERALAVHAESLRALRLRAALALREEWTAEAQHWVDAFARAAPEALAPALLRARLADALERPEQGAEFYAQAWRADRSRRETWFAYLRALEYTADLERARELAEELLARAPAEPGVVARVADHYARFGDTDRALDLYRQACKALPTAAMLWRERGDLHLRRGDDEAARQAYEHALALNPSHHALRRLVHDLRGEAYAFWDRYAVDPMDKLREDAAHQHPGGTVRLVDQTVMEVYPDGSYAESVHQLQKVLTREGISYARQVPVYGEILEARTILPQGQILEPLRLSERNAFTMPGLAPGAAVEYRQFVSHPGRTDRGFYAPCWYFRSPDIGEDFMFSQYIVRVPADLPFHYVQRNFDIPPTVRTEEDGTRVYTWTMRNMPRVWQETHTPPINQFLPFVELGSPFSWDEVARLLRDRYLGRLQPTAELTEVVRRLTEGATTEVEEVERLYRYVLERVDESPLAGGASTIHARRSGSRLIVLMALLRIAGLDARYAGVRPPPEILPEPNWELPQTDHFPVEAVAVFLADRHAPLWLDLRYRAAAPGQLVEDLAGATAFVVGPQGGEFHDLPRAGPDAFGATQTEVVTLDANTLSAQIRGERVVRGAEGLSLKESLPELDRRDRIRRLEQRKGEAFSAVTAQRMETPGIDAPGGPYRGVYELEAYRALGDLGGGRLALGLGLASLEVMTDMQARPAARHNPFHLDTYLVGRNRVRITIPDGYVVDDLPAGLYEKDVFGSYRLTVRAEGDTIEVSRRYAFPPQVVAVEDYPRIAKMARRIHLAEQSRITLRPVEESSPQP